MDNWNVYYYDNEEVIKSKKEYSLPPSKVKELIKGGSRGLDYEYTVVCKILDLFTKSHPHLSLDVIKQLESIILRGEEGPIKEKAINLMRKIIVDDEKAYVELLKTSKGEETLSIFKNIPLKEKLLNTQLEASNLEIINNLLFLLKLQKVKDL